MWRSVVVKKCLAVALEGVALSSPPPLFSSTSPPHPPHSTQQVVSDTVASAVQKEVESSIKLHAGKLGSEARLQEERKRKEVCVLNHLQIPCSPLLSSILSSNLQ